MKSAKGWAPVGTVLLVLGMTCGNSLAAGPWPEEIGDWTSPPACVRWSNDYHRGQPAASIVDGERQQ